MPISSIVVANDGSNHATAALKMAVELALRFDAKLTVVHVYMHDHPPSELKHMVEVEHLAGTGRIAETAPSIPAFDDGNFNAKETIAEERVIAALAEQITKNAVSSARESGVKEVSAVIRSGDYANQIIAVANDQQADMIVMGRRGLSNLKGLLFGSVSQKVSQRADCSVLTVK